MTNLADLAHSAVEVEDGPRRRTSKMWLHVAALALLLLLLFPLMHPTSVFSSDEGAYALQVEALEQGSWVYDYRASRLDPEGRAFPLILTGVGPAGHYTYAKHPAVPLVLLYSTKVFGRTVGLHLFSLLGLIGAAVAAWLVAGEIDPRLRRPAFWLAAGSPVLVNGFMIWAHAPSAALAGLAMVGAMRVARDRVSPLAASGMAAALAGGVLLRSEGLLFAAALAVVVLAIRVQAKRRPIAAAMTLGLVVAPAVLVAVVERRWVSSIMGRSYGVPGQNGDIPSSFWAERARSAWHVLFNGSYLDSHAGLPTLVGLAVVVVLGVVALRRWGPASRSRLTMAVAGSVALLAIRFAGFPDQTVTGLLPAAPLLVLGVLLVRWQGSQPVTWVLAGTVALFTVAVLATQYPEGGGFEWGGRYLSPLLVPLAVLAAIGLVRAVDGVGGGDRRQAVGLLVALGVATAGFSLATSGVIRAESDAVIAAVARHPSPVSVTTQSALPRGAWRADLLTWMLTNDAGTPDLLRSLRRQGVPQVTLVVDRALPPSAMAAYPVLKELDEPALARAGLKLVIAST